MEAPSTPKKIYGIMTFIFEGSNKEKFGVFLALIKKVVSNIIQNPQEPKFRSLRKTNKALQDKLFIHPNMHELLTSLGFVLETDTYTFLGNNTRVLEEFEIILEGFEVQMEAYKNNLGVDPVEASRRQKIIEEEVRDKEREMAKLEELAHFDRLEKMRELKDHPACDSVGKDLKFGATVLTTKEFCPPSSK